MFLSFFCLLPEQKLFFSALYQINNKKIKECISSGLVSHRHPLINTTYFTETCYTVCVKSHIFLNFLCAAARSAWRQLGWGSASSVGRAWSNRRAATGCRAAAAASCATSAESPSPAITTSASTPGLPALPAATAASAPSGPTPRCAPNSKHSHNHRSWCLFCFPLHFDLDHLRPWLPTAAWLQNHWQPTGS